MNIPLGGEKGGTAIVSEEDYDKISKCGRRDWWSYYINASIYYECYQKNPDY